MHDQCTSCSLFLCNCVNSSLSYPLFHLLIFSPRRENFPKLSNCHFKCWAWASRRFRNSSYLPRTPSHMQKQKTNWNMRKMHIRSAIEHAVEASQHLSGIAGAQINHQAGILSTLAHLRAEPEWLNESRCTRLSNRRRWRLSCLSKLTHCTC